MLVEVKILDKYKMPYGTEVEINYTCPHCGESVTEIICFSGECENEAVDLEDHECPECGEENDLEFDFY